MRRLQRVTMVVAVAVLLAGGVRPAAAAKRGNDKPKLFVVIAGHHLKAKGAAVEGAYSTSFFVFGGGSRHGRRVQTVQSLTVGPCGPVSLATTTFPVTVSCGGIYTYSKFSRRPVGKAWAAGADGITVEVDSFENGLARGTFHGALPPGDTNPSDPPANVVKGVFTVTLVQGGV